jgi:hypothetical protein
MRNGRFGIGRFDDATAKYRHPRQFVVTTGTLSADPLLKGTNIPHPAIWLRDCILFRRMFNENG